MDIVTHGITGVLVSRALPSGHRGSMMAAGLIGALAPDVDVVASHPLGILGGPLSLRIWIDGSNSVRKVEFGHRF